MTAWDILSSTHSSARLRHNLIPLCYMKMFLSLFTFAPLKPRCESAIIVRLSVWLMQAIVNILFGSKRTWPSAMGSIVRGPFQLYRLSFELTGPDHDSYCSQQPLQFFFRKVKTDLSNCAGLEVINSDFPG
jgi:hypothetical protein